MIKFLKRLLITIAVVVLIWFFFGSQIYRACISYDFIGDTKQYTVENAELKKYIDENSNNEKADIEEVIEDAQELCTDKLNFTFMYCDIDPNELISSKKSNCIGYATFTTATINYLITKNKVQPEWRARPLKGQLYLFGKNMHDWFSSPFFRDHDFVIIENTKTLDKYYIDPTVNDYLGIDYVRIKK